MKTKNSDNFFAFTKRSIKKKISLIISVFLLFMCIPLQNVFADTTMVKNTFLINNGDYRTENYSIVTITLDISNCQYIQLSNDGVNYSPQQPYTTSTSWNLSNSYGGNSSLGTKTVYLKATEKDTSNTQIYQSSIVYGNMTNHLFELYNTLGTGNQINYVDAQFHVFFTNCNYIQLSNDGVNYSPKQNYHEGASYQTFNWDITNSLYGGSDSIGYKTVFMKATGLVPEDTEVYQTTLIYTHNQGWIVPKVNNLSSDGLVWDNLTTGWHSTGTTATINVDTDGAWLIWTSTYPGIPHYVPIIDKQAILTFESAGTAFYPRIYIDDITRTEGIHYDYIGTTPIPVVKGSTTIKYQDENGTDLETPTVNSNLDMNTYSYNAKSFTGYTTTDTTKAVTLTALDADQTIIFNYISIPVIKGSATIKYQDENGTDLEAPTVNSNLDMNTYSYKAKSFTGYTITGDTTKSVTLTIIDKDRIVIFKYKKNLTLVSLKLPQTGSSIDFMSLCLLGILFIIIGSFFSLLKPKKSNK